MRQILENKFDLGKDKVYTLMGNKYTGHSKNDLLNKFDLIYTPGSYFMQAKRDFENSNKPIGTIEKYTTYTGAAIFETLRVILYLLFATVSPIIPLGFISIGLLSKFFNKNINVNHKKY